MPDYTYIAFFVFLAFLLSRYLWPKFYNVSAGVKENLDRIKKRLDDLGVEHSSEISVDGTCLYDFNEEVAPRLLSRKKKLVEVALGIIKVSSSVNGEKLEKAVSIVGRSAPRPHLALGLTPKHCWGYDPRALMAFNNDPKLGEVEYRINIRPNNIQSQMLPKEIIETAVGYLTRIESERTFDKHKDGDWL